MPPQVPDDSGFVERFERAMEGTGNRLRTLETGQASVKQELRGLKEDRCDKHAKSIEELFQSRNQLQSSLDRLQTSASGLQSIFANLDKTVDDLDRRALLLGKGEESVLNKLEKIQDWEVPERLLGLEQRMDAVEAERSEVRKKSRDWKLLLCGALLTVAASTASGLLVYYLTHHP